VGTVLDDGADISATVSDPARRRLGVEVEQDGGMVSQSECYSQIYRRCRLA
jgi:hypothetical protein